MSVYAFGCRIYLDSAPSVANAADIGLYDDADNGANSVFRWIDTDISSYSPTYTWKTGVLSPDPFTDIEESVDLRNGGNLPSVGGSVIGAVNTLSYGGTFTQLDYILDSNDININGLRCDYVRFEVSSGSLVEVDGDVVFRGICGDPTWTYQKYNIPLQTALLKRRANILTKVNTDDFPDASPSIIGNCISAVFGEFKPEFDSYNNPVYKGYAKFSRVADKVNVYRNITNTIINTTSNLEQRVGDNVINCKVFPVVVVGGGVTPTTYRIKIGTDGDIRYYINSILQVAGTYTFEPFVNSYIKIVKGAGIGKQRMITNATITLTAFPESWTYVDLTIKDIFEENLCGNATATADEQSWMQIADISREYKSDVWECKDFLDENGDVATDELSLYSFSGNENVTVTGSAETVAINSKIKNFYQIPGCCYDIKSGSKNTELEFLGSHFEEYADRINSFLFLTPDKVSLYDEDDLSALGLSNYEKYVDGLYHGTTGTDNRFVISDDTVTGSIDNIIDKTYTSYWQRYLTMGTISNTYWRHVLKLELPDLPAQLGDGFAIYFGVQLYCGWTNFIHQEPTFISIRNRSFIGDCELSIDKQNLEDNVDGNLPENLKTIDNTADFYFDSPRPSRDNERFYKATSDSGTLMGYTYGDLGGIDTREAYERLQKNCFLSIKRDFDTDTDFTFCKDLVKIHNVYMAIKKTISIKDAIYTPYQGRIYNGTWGQSEGSSSSSSSSLSSSSSSSSSSFSSQSSPSSSSSSSSSSFSSTSSSSSSSATIGRKNPDDMIDNPVDILEHIMRLQNWSEQDEIKNWGKEYPNKPLIDVSTSEGGFDYEDLEGTKDFRPARQIMEENNGWTDDIARSLCKAFFLVSYQNPTTGNECVSYMADKSLSNPSLTLTLNDILGSIEPVKSPVMKGIFTEPMIRYCKNNATGEYEKSIQITNTNAATFDSSYVIGLEGTTAEMLWTRAHVLREVYKQVEPLPRDMSDNDWIVKDEDAVLYLDTLLMWMGAINTDGTTGGITYEPKKRISFTIPYSVGKDLFLTKHVKLQLPHQTNNAAIEGVIERLTKGIKKGREFVKMQLVLYGAANEIDLYIQDTYDTGTLLTDWADTYDTQAVAPTNGADIADIT